jgi:hypothetical protein
MEFKNHEIFWKVLIAAIRKILSQFQQADEAREKG